MNQTTDQATGGTGRARMLRELTTLLEGHEVTLTSPRHAGQTARIVKVLPNGLYPGSVWIECMIGRQRYMAEPGEITLTR